MVGSLSVLASTAATALRQATIRSAPAGWVLRQFD